MSVRELLCLPKRMLVFFAIDESTCILDTNKVLKVLEGENVVEDALVLVKYGKEELEARVLKLHGKIFSFVMR